MVKVNSPEVLSFKSEKAKAKHLTKYRAFRSAQRVWRQIEDPDRAYVLTEIGYSDIDGAIELERRAGYDLSTLKAGTGAKLNRLLTAIRFYPRSPRQREKYKARPPRPADVRVRKHERELRAKGLRRPRRPLSRRAIPIGVMNINQARRDIPRRG